MLLLLLMLQSALAQELDLSSLQSLEEKLPSYSGIELRKEETVYRHIGDNKYSPPANVVDWKKIKNSGHEMGSLEIGAQVVRLEDNEVFKLGRPIFVKYYKIQDEQGFTYLINQNGTTTFMINSRFIQPIKEELALYEPPLKYTPGPVRKVIKTYDKKLTISPEASIYLGYVAGEYMRDLFNDSKARSGISTQYGAHAFTSWELPLKVGVAAHYEKTSYDLADGSVEYSSLSIGPLIKSRDLEAYGLLYRMQLQIRVSPFAKAHAVIGKATTDFRFNSTDLLASFDHPIRNRWGDFVFGAFFQSQWLNIKDQTEIVSIRASNKANNTFGFSLSQVFE